MIFGAAKIVLSTKYFVLRKRNLRLCEIQGVAGTSGYQALPFVLINMLFKYLIPDFS